MLVTEVKLKVTLKGQPESIQHTSETFIGLPFDLQLTQWVLGQSV